MKSISNFCLLVSMPFLVALGGGAAVAQDASMPAPPDPTHIPFKLPQDIKWNGDPKRGELQAPLFGDPSKPGMYGVLIKWTQGYNSRPHFHDQDRFIYVVSGTWWVSSSNKYDLSTMYPLHAGTFAEDVANTVHWDGSKATDPDPAVLELVGMGPVKTIQVDENGKPLPPRGGGGAPAAPSPQH